MCSQACALDAAAAPCLARPRVAPKLMLGRPAVLAAGCSPLPSSGTLGGTSWPAVGLRLDERHKTIRRVRWMAVRQRWADDELELPAPRSGGQRGPGPARTLHRCCIMRHATCGSHATCGTPGTRRGSVGYGRGILAARRTGQSSRTAQSRLTLHVLHWHGLHWRRSRGTSAGLTTTAALAAAALATTWWEGWLRHRTRSRSRARARRPTHASPRPKRRRVHKKKIDDPRSRATLYTSLSKARSLGRRRRFIRRAPDNHSTPLFLPAVGQVPHNMVPHLSHNFGPSELSPPCTASAGLRLRGRCWLGRSWRIVQVQVQVQVQVSHHHSPSILKPPLRMPLRPGLWRSASLEST